jgi:hypothetical protein
MSEKPTPPTIDQQFHALVGQLRSVSSIDDAALRDRLAELDRVVNMAHAAQAAVMHEMAHRAGPSEYEFVADEIAITVTTTKAVASDRFGLALGAVSHPVVMQAWSRGDIDARKVQVLCEGLADASPLALETLTEGAVAQATSHTAPELRRWLQRRVMAADPGAAESQRRRALNNRKITVTPFANGLSELTALLPSVQARQIYDTVNAVAHSFDHADARTMDQKRSDAFVDLVIGRAEPPRVSLNVVVPIETMVGASNAPATMHGVGPITAHQARRLTLDRDITRLLTDPINGQLLGISERQYRPSSQLERLVRTRDWVCRFPGCSRPATTKHSGTDLDHTVPWPEGETAASNLAVLCRHHHRLKHSPGWSVSLASDGAMSWTTPTGKTFVTQARVHADTG